MTAPVEEPAVRTVSPYLALVVVILAPHAAPAQLIETTTWTGAIDGNWGVAGNWNPVRVPGGANTSIIFGGSANQTITLGTDRIVDQLSVGSSTAYVFNAGNTLIQTPRSFTIWNMGNSGSATFNCDIDLNGVEVRWQGVNALASGEVNFAGVIKGTGTASILRYQANSFGTFGFRFSGSSSNTFQGQFIVDTGNQATPRLVLLDKSAGDAYTGSQILFTSGTNAILRNLRSNQIGDSSAVSLNNRGVYDLNGFTETLFSIGSASVGTITSEIRLGTGGALTVTNGLGNNGVISGAGGTITLAGGGGMGGTLANTYTGLTTVSGGTLGLSKTAGVTAIPGELLLMGSGIVQIFNSEQIPNTTSVVMQDSSKFQVGSNLNAPTETVGSLVSASGSTRIEFRENAATLNTGDATNHTYAGQIGFIAGLSGVNRTGNVVKLGSGTWTLTGNSTQDAFRHIAVTVAEGRLNVNGSLGLGVSGSLTVANGATLGGTGTVGGPVTILGGGSLSPGTTNPGTLSVTGNLSLAATSGTSFQLGGSTPGSGTGFYSQANVTGAANLDGSLIVTAGGGFDPTGKNFFILSRGSGAGTFASLPEGSTLVFADGQYQGSITYLANWTNDPLTSTPTGGNDVALVNVIPVPEQATVLAIAAASLGLGSFVRRRYAGRVVSS